MPRESHRDGSSRDAPKGQVYPNRRKLNEATLTECRQSYEALFGKPWDADAHTEWLSWLRQSRAAEKDALKALAKLRQGVEALVRFNEAHPARHEEHRRGLRVERAIQKDGTVEDHFYLDLATLPEAVSPEVRIAAASTPRLDIRSKLTNSLLVPTDWDYSIEVQGVVAGTSVELVWSRRAIEFSPAAMSARLLRGMLEDVSAFLAVSPSRQTPVAWDGALAVVARFDRAYAPLQLRERRGKQPAPGRLTDTELAIIFILVTGQIPHLAPGKLLRVSIAIDTATRAIARARKSMESYRAAHMGTPRSYDGSTQVGQAAETAPGSAAT
jgi:hypothetical protein